MDPLLTADDPIADAESELHESREALNRAAADLAGRRDPELARAVTEADYWLRQAQRRVGQRTAA
jgi:hypothetical protein